MTPAKCQNRLPYGKPAKQNSLKNVKQEVATALDHFLNAVAYAFVLSFPAAQGATSWKWQPHSLHKSGDFVNPFFAVLSKARVWLAAFLHSQPYQTRFLNGKQASCHATAFYMQKNGWQCPGLMRSARLPAERLLPLAGMAPARKICRRVMSFELQKMTEGRLVARNTVATRVMHAPAISSLPAARPA